MPWANLFTLIGAAVSLFGAEFGVYILFDIHPILGSIWAHIIGVGIGYLIWSRQ